MSRIAGKTTTTLGTLIVLALLAVKPTLAMGQIFVVNDATGTIGEYNTSGVAINASLVSGLSYPTALATDGKGHLFVENSGSVNTGEYTTSGVSVNASLPFFGKGIACDAYGHIFIVAADGIVGEYTTSGSTINASLITGLNTSDGGVALDGKGDIFVQHEPYPQNTLTIGEWTTNGVAINSQLISGDGNSGIACDGNGHLFILNGNLNGVAEYTTSGSTVNASLITGLTDAFGLALDGDGHIFVAYSVGAAGYVGEYTTAGAAVNATLISGLHSPDGLVVIPETIASPSVKPGSPRSLTVSWPAPGAYILQTNRNLSASGWNDYSGAVGTANGTNTVTITPSGTSLYFRLRYW